MLPEVPLVASDVHRDLWSALAPVEDRMVRNWPGLKIEHIRLVIQLHPLRIQVVTAAQEGRPARRVAVWEGAEMPDKGKALGEAAEALVAAVLAEQGTTVAEAVAEASMVPGGGLCVIAEPLTGSLGAVVAGPREGMEKALNLGGIGAPVTAH